MPTCPRCGTENEPQADVCGQCRRALIDPGPASGLSLPTMNWQGQLPQERGVHRSVALEGLFAGRTKIVLGRTADCDVCLAHPTVSRHHALIERGPGGLRVADLGSVNGVQVDGLRIVEPVLVGDEHRLSIGPFLFRFAGGFLHILDSSQSLRLEARGLERVVGPPLGRKFKLLDDINLVLDPGEFLCLLGPSGSGKSTLMDCLSGRRPATGGSVLANGEDFYLHFNSFRQSLGYVPQRDIVHTQLSVQSALYYTAKLRLPPDTHSSELDNRVKQVLQRMELVPHKDTLVGNLSGGQIKRVSLGAELLARPCLLFIDEATSGLDAGTETRLMHLFRELGNEGKSIVCITHHVDNVDLCHLLLILARGKLIYYGPPADARAYFNVARVSEIYDSLAAKEPEVWEKDFRACSLFKTFVSDRQQASAVSSARLRAQTRSKEGSLVLSVPPVKVQRPLLQQFGVISCRYLEMIWRDRRSLILMVLQAPLVAAFILLGFANRPYAEKILAPRILTQPEKEVVKSLAKFTKDAIDRHAEVFERLDEDQRLRQFPEFLDELADVKGPVMPFKVIVNPRFTYMLTFLVVLIVVWFGCNNASKEIVKEQAIYARERAVNLGILPYLASKFIVLGTITAIQAGMLMGCVYGTLELLHWYVDHAMPYPEYRLDYLPQLGVLTVLAFTAVAMGLLLSAWVSSPDQANVLLPYVLIPQIILGGGILPIKDGPLKWLAELLSPAYWGYRGIQRGTTTLPPDLPWHMDYNDSVWLACAAMAGQIVVLLGMTAFFLRAKDPGKA